MDSPAEFHGGQLAWLLTRLRQEFRQADEFWPLLSEGLALEIVVEAGRGSRMPRRGQPPRWLRQAEDLLRSRCTEKLTLTEISRAVRIHPVHLSRMFRRHYGCTMGEYVRRLRVEFAADRLAHSAAPLIEVGLAAGFCSQSHFIRTFGRLVGITPSEYRRAHQTR